jgi:hypothetical protein
VVRFSPSHIVLSTVVRSKSERDEDLRVGNVRRADVAADC